MEYKGKQKYEKYNHDNRIPQYTTQQGSGAGVVTDREIRCKWCGMPEKFLKPHRVIWHSADCMEGMPSEDEYWFFVNGTCKDGLDCKITKENHCTFG